ncbi:hypothetical protein RO3G_10585 [Rhizopus delemar RA 99-880]|uniref:Uncharacterized protein n=1 Tax=Rhizopus delemar (strain RA 99-880 / ATCC MYA-4621 / FGSC 9543 / NRRL 43880) TaxID=246409 RepID=I1CBP5_RHIO9|nr:hypothetical protein RO3G_10585 [Rhizopus delemar RA 99-880]|eukprot:EIE85875.1 hypothetical protein RO3G_10585 [Rhizopus delemar RA 99-880]
MLVKVEPAPFEGGKLRHSTSDQLLINKKNTVNRKSLVGTPDNGKHTAAESPEISIVNKRKPLKRLEDGACIVLSENRLPGETGIFQKVTTLKLVLVILPMMVEVAVLETTEMV